MLANERQARYAAESTFRRDTQMKKWLLAAVLLVAGPATAGAQATPTAADSAEIFGAIANWERAWKVQDAALAAQDYSDDADWTNAFGMRRTGRGSIKALLEEVFNLPFVMAGNTEYEYHDVRFVRSDVAVLRSRAIRAGQQLPDGTVEEDRRTNHLRIFERRDGRWSIISHLIGDERTPGRPR